MRIAQLATNMERVPPTGYGGTELVVSLLTEALVERGHTVTLFASGDSVTKAHLVSVIEKPLRANSQILPRQWQSYDLQTLLLLQDQAQNFDIIHNHMGYQALPYLSQLKQVVLTTNHNPIKFYNLPIYQRFAHLPYIAISEAYKRLNYPNLLNYVATIHNGINPQSYAIDNSRQRSYLLFLGRICQDKGTAEAIDLAHRLKVPLKIAGKIDEADQSYFESRIKPHLNKDCEYIGEVQQTTKLALYQGAIALAHLVNFEEPFGLVLVEALACGTPVMAFERGSIREILVDGKTAVLGQTVSELAHRFAELTRIRPEICRKHVEENFSVAKMTDSYEDLYESLCVNPVLTKY